MVDVPPLPSVPNVLKARLLWSDQLDVDVSSTLYFRYTGAAPSAGDCATFASDIDAAMGAAKNLWDDTVQLTGCTVTDLSSDTGGEGSVSGTIPGPTSLGLLSGGTCLLMNYTISRRYRGGKPRNYFPWGGGESLASRQGWSASFLASCNSEWATFTAAVIGLSSGTTTIAAHTNVSYYAGTKVVISPTTGRARNVPILRATPLASDIVSASAAVRPGTQRRRNRG